MVLVSYSNKKISQPLNAASEIFLFFEAIAINNILFINRGVK